MPGVVGLDIWQDQLVKPIRHHYMAKLAQSHEEILV